MIAIPDFTLVSPPTPPFLHHEEVRSCDRKHSENDISTSARDLFIVLTAMMYLSDTSCVSLGQMVHFHPLTRIPSFFPGWASPIHVSLIPW